MAQLAQHTAQILGESLQRCAAKLRTRAELDHARTSARAVGYQQTKGRLAQTDLARALDAELRRGPDYKHFHRGSNFDFRQTPRISTKQARHWLAEIERAPRKPHGTKASAGALPPITQATLITARQLAHHAMRVGTVQISAAKLAREIRPRKRAIEYALQALKGRGFLERHLVVTRRTGRLQMHCVQDANAYVLRLPTTGDLWRYPAG